MSSLIPGYEYDIFISYRQKDNKGDRWVSEFVDALKTELESTFKEEISVYFDINPHDGLLETHDVDASLKDKLKCLIFIPIISRTYCDPKSFAWQHEFTEFVDLASQDQFGLKVKLQDGNVAGRVLPVRIHDLDSEDIKLCESVLGVALRGVEFIYKSAGVNRPLRSTEEKPHDNLNKTIYRDQINKVANAIKEIISGLRGGEVVSGREKIMAQMPWEETKNEKGLVSHLRAENIKRFKLLSLILSISILVLLAGVFAYPKIFKGNTLEKLRSSGERISVVVMPFQNMTNDTIWNIWQDGIQNILITNLSNLEELKVRQLETVTSIIQSKGLTDYASLTPLVASNISQKLAANVFIHGSINQAGSTIRLNAQLIDSKTEEVLKSFRIDGIAENILHIIDSLSKEVKNFLIISKLVMEETSYDRKYNIASTTSPKVFKYVLEANHNGAKQDYTAAINLYLQALAIDSTYTDSYIMIIWCYLNQQKYDEAKKWYIKAYEKKNLMPQDQKINVNVLHAFLFGTDYEKIGALRQQQDFDNQNPMVYNDLGIIYLGLLQYDKAIHEFEKSFEIYEKWGVKPYWVIPYTGLAKAYHMTGQYKKEKKLYSKAEKDFPDNYILTGRQATLSLTEGDTVSANDFIKKYISLRKESSASEANIAASLAFIYSQAGVLKKAEEYYRQALLIEPDKPYWMGILAYFMIDKDRNIEEGMGIIDKVLIKYPDDYNCLHCKGWGLYKKGIYKEALEILQKSWDIRTEKAIYNHEAYLHLEAAKKAVARLK